MSTRFHAIRMWWVAFLILTIVGFITDTRLLYTFALYGMFWSNGFMWGMGKTAR